MWRSSKGGSAPFAEAIETALHPREWHVSESRELQVFLVLSRRGLFTEGQKRLELPAPSLAWLPGGQGRKLRLEAGASGHHLTVRIDRVLAALSGLSGTTRMRSLTGRGLFALPPRLERHAAEVAQSFEVLAREGREPTEGSDAVTAAHLALLCVHVSRSAEAEIGAQGPSRDKAASVVERFLGLLELHLCDGWSVKRYADVLGVSPDRLHAATIRRLGKAPGHHIKECLLSETRNRLERSDLPADQIAFALGFKDPSYFSRFCLKHLGAPPGRYRRNSRTKSESGEVSFAAWP